MAAFGFVLTDADVTRLVIWLRSTFSPDDPWRDVPASIARMRISDERED